MLEERQIETVEDFLTIDASLSYLRVINIYIVLLDYTRRARVAPKGFFVLVRSFLKYVLITYFCVIDAYFNQTQS